MAHPRVVILLVLLFAAVFQAVPATLQAQADQRDSDQPLAFPPVAPPVPSLCDDPCVGPSAGALVLAGGGRLDPEIYERFVELAGGAGSRIIIIPTASRGEHFPSDWHGFEPFLEAGAGEIRVLHTRHRAEANTEAFADPIRYATGVWLMGGRPWRLVDAYKGSRVEDELHLLLARGGVVGGTSAGASMMASFLVRGAPEDNGILVAEKTEYRQGFGFLQGAAVDQHVLARGRVQDLLTVLADHPRLLGIGLDEGAGLVVRGDQAEVIGRSVVAIYNPGKPYLLFDWFEPGEFYDLGARMEDERAARRPVADHFPR